MQAGSEPAGIFLGTDSSGFGYSLVSDRLQKTGGVWALRQPITSFLYVSSMLIPALRTLKACSASQRSCAPSQHRCEELSTRLHTYTFRHRLGRGAFGQVFLAEVVDDTAPTFGRKKHGNRLVAVKIIRRAKLEKESTRALARAEAENLRRISEAKSLFFTQLRETFSDGHNLYIVTVSTSHSYLSASDVFTDRTSSLAERCVER